jgi:hypothetical protein
VVEKTGKIHAEINALALQIKTQAITALTNVLKLLIEK